MEIYDSQPPSKEVEIPLPTDIERLKDRIACLAIYHIAMSLKYKGLPSLMPPFAGHPIRSYNLFQGDKTQFLSRIRGALSMNCIENTLLHVAYGKIEKHVERFFLNTREKLLDIDPNAITLYCLQKLKEVIQTIGTTAFPIAQGMQEHPIDFEQEMWIQEKTLREVEGPNPIYFFLQAALEAGVPFNLTDPVSKQKVASHLSMICNRLISKEDIPDALEDLNHKFHPAHIMKAGHHMINDFISEHSDQAAIRKHIWQNQMRLCQASMSEEKRMNYQAKYRDNLAQFGHYQAHMLKASAEKAYLKKLGCQGNMTKEEYLKNRCALLLTDPKEFLAFTKGHNNFASYRYETVLKWQKDELLRQEVRDRHPDCEEELLEYFIMDAAEAKTKEELEIVPPFPHSIDQSELYSALSSRFDLDVARMTTSSLHGWHARHVKASYEKGIHFGIEMLLSLIGHPIKRKGIVSSMIQRHVVPVLSTFLPPLIIGSLEKDGWREMIFAQLNVLCQSFMSPPLPSASSDAPSSGKALPPMVITVTDEECLIARNIVDTLCSFLERSHSREDLAILGQHVLHLIDREALSRLIVTLLKTSLGHRHLIEQLFSTLLNLTADQLEMYNTTGSSPDELPKQILQQSEERKFSEIKGHLVAHFIREGCGSILPGIGSFVGSSLSSLGTLLSRPFVRRDESRVSAVTLPLSEQELLTNQVIAYAIAQLSTGTLARHALTGLASAAWNRDLRLTADTFAIEKILTAIFDPLTHVEVQKALILNLIGDFGSIQTSPRQASPNTS